MRLAEPLTLPCGVTLKNRIAKAAMTEGLANGWNAATPRHVTLYRRWAMGGAGLLLTGNVLVDRRYLERAGNVAIDGPQTPGQLAALRAFAAAGTENGAHCWMQISHAGRQSPKAIATEPVGPSAIAVDLPGGQFAAPRALSATDIEDVIARFVHAARTAKETGFTGVQIHAAHGYLVSEFLNPRVNQREDEWGGSLENRARLLLTLVKQVRKAVGKAYPVSVKLNSSDFQKCGFSFEDCLKVVAMLNTAGVDLLEISGGNYEQPKMMGLEGMEPVFEGGEAKSTRAREAYFIPFAEEIAKVAKMPLMVTGGFRTPSAMDEALASGAADVIGIGRPLCVRPELPNGLLAGTVLALPSYEKDLQMGPGPLGRKATNKTIRALNGFGAMSFFYLNLFRLADGLDGQDRMALFPAFIKHQTGEAKAAKALKGRG
jgi:2,4-dienoyl-CoA reductase-like NADH-dependent reductase (Old Yellow Enzyme family)